MPQPIRGRSSVIRQSGIVSASYIPLIRASGTITGLDRNRTTGGTYNRHTCGFTLYVPYVVEAIRWDLRASGTHEFSFVNQLGNSPTILYMINPSFYSAGVGAENLIATPSNILLLPGQHYVSFYKTGTASAVDDYNSAPSVAINSYMIMTGNSYNDTVSSYVGAFKLVGYPVDFPFGWQNYMASPL